MSAHLLARVGVERYAFALSTVAEALDAPALHAPLLCPDGLLGTLRHRGRTLDVWDSAHAFGVRRASGDGTAIVLSDGGHSLALVVDDAVDIVELAADALQEPPVGTDAHGLLAGVACDAHGLVSVVHVEALLGRLTTWSARSAG